MAGHSVRFYEFGPFRIDLLSRVLLRDGKPLPLEPKVFDTLLALVENHAKVVSKDELMNAVWGPDTFVEEGGLARNISLLRKTLGEGLKGAQCIATFPKRGYQFVAPVREVAGTSESEPGASVGARRRLAPTAVMGLPRPQPGVRPGGHALAEIGNGQPEGVPLQRALEEVGNGHPQGAPLQEDRGGRGWLVELLRRHPIAILAGGIALLALALGYWFVRQLPAPAVGGHQELTHDGREKRGPLLTDGARLYFEENVDGKWMLAVIPSGGGNPITYPLPSSDVWISDIAPDGSDLVGWEVVPGGGQRLLVWPVAGGAAEVLGGLQGKWPTWSPEGARIAYSDGIHSVFVAGRHGENPRKMATVEGRPSELRWSPDGKVLRFSQYDPRSEVESLWEVPAVRGEPRLVLRGAGRHVGFGPAWTADGSYSLFVSGPEGGLDIWARRENCNPFRWRCREPIRLTAGPLKYDDPLPSRDSSKLLVIGGQSKTELVRYDLKSRTFVPYLPTVLAGDLDFSPDGEWVAYARLPERILWRSRLDGSNATPLTVSGAEAYSPHWSPDGQQIAYMAIFAQNQYKACVVPADGGPPQQLVPGAGEEGIPTWSRDGKFLVFGDVNHARHASEMAIHLLDLRSHQVSTLPGSAGLWTPRWSPDGRYIAALALGDEAKGQLAVCPAVLLYDRRTRRWTTLANIWNIWNLAWSRDSQYVYFHTASPERGLYRVQIVSKRVEPLASLKDFPQGDDWIGVTPDGSPLIMKGTHIQEIYALDVEWP